MSRDIIRSGEDSAYVSALFTQLPQDVCAKIEEMGFEMQDDTLLIAREVGSRNLCKVNGRPATVQLLREIASMLSISESTVRVQIKIAVDRILEGLRRYYPDLKLITLLLLLFSDRL